jgi:hypothetical protein
MALKRFWKSWPATAAALLLMLAAPVLAQQIPPGSNVTVYESPT